MLPAILIVNRRVTRSCHLKPLGHRIEAVAYRLAISGIGKADDNAKDRHAETQLGLKRRQGIEEKQTAARIGSSNAADFWSVWRIASGLSVGGALGVSERDGLAILLGSKVNGLVARS